MEKIQAQLSGVQNNLVAPKDLFNKFGGYSHRSCETILEAVKPLLLYNNITLTISDEVVNIGERYYVKATATVTNIEGQTISVSAYAREDQSLKGMNESQITGSTSSYARKYALNGLFCIDDTKDSDATNKHDKGQQGTTTNNKGNKPITTNDPEPEPTGTVESKANGNTDGKTTDTLVCSDCGIAITQKVYDYSIEKKGKALCYVCQKK